MVVGRGSETQLQVGGKWIAIEESKPEVCGLILSYLKQDVVVGGKHGKADVHRII